MPFQHLDFKPMIFLKKKYLMDYHNNKELSAVIIQKVYRLCPKHLKGFYN